MEINLEKNLIITVMTYCLVIILVSKKLEYADKFLKKNDFVIVSGVAHERSWRESAKKKFENLIEIFF